MSYDLDFWRQSVTEMRTPREIFKLICDSGEPPVELESLPLADIIDQILVAFPEAVREPNGPDEWIVWHPSPSLMFEVSWSERHFWVTLRGAWTGDVANRLIDIGRNGGCRLYDPQTNQRYE